MKKLTVLLTVSLFGLSVAQQVKPATKEKTTKKECSTKDKKACDASGKKAHCASMKKA